MAAEAPKIVSVITSCGSCNPPHPNNIETCGTVARLEPCPFCGSTSIAVRFYNQPSVCCADCLAMGPASPNRLTKANKDACAAAAVELWNKRYAKPPWWSQ